MALRCCSGDTIYHISTVESTEAGAKGARVDGGELDERTDPDADTVAKPPSMTAATGTPDSLVVLQSPRSKESEQVVLQKAAMVKGYRALTKIGTRREPGVSSDKTGRVVEEGDFFEVSREVKGDGGQRYLKLKNEDGWVLAQGVAGEWSGKPIVAAAEEAATVVLRSPRIKESSLVHLAAEEAARVVLQKESEKGALQEVVRDFARAAAAGAPVGFIDAETADVSRAVLVLNMALGSLRLQPADAEEWDLYLTDICHVFKGVELERRAPGLQDVAPCCLGIDVHPGVRPVFLHFGDAAERDRFYTCLRILCLSAEASLRRQASPRPRGAGPAE